jgi:hypothetical protein
MQASKFRRVRVPPIESPVTRRKVGWRLLIVILAVAGVLAAGCGGGGNGSGGEYEQNGVGELHVLIQRSNTMLGLSLECFTFYDGGLIELRHSGNQEVSDTGLLQRRKPRRD